MKAKRKNVQDATLKNIRVIKEAQRLFARELVRLKKRVKELEESSILIEWPK
jgi:hypothetical protein